MTKANSISIFLFAQLVLLLSISLKAQNDSSKMKPIGKEAFEVMKQFFEYDKGIPLDVHIVAKTEEQDYVREKIVFSGLDNSRIPGYLAIPKKGNAPYPCILQLHGIGGSKEGWWIEGNFVSGGELTKRLLASGFAVLSLDAEYHGERLANNDFESSEVFTFQKGWFLKARDMIVQSTIEYRRAIDFLATRKDIDSSKIGMIGYSMGGIMTFQLSSLDSRIKASVACVTPILKAPYSAMDVNNFASQISLQPFLMLIGNADQRNYSPADAQQLFDLISSPVKEIVSYESGHKLPEQWTKKAVEWMEKHLK